MGKTKKELTPTEREYRKLRNTHRALSLARFPTAMSPLAVELAVYWQDWFPSNADKLSIGWGLALALISTIATVLAIIKKDSEIMKKIGPLLGVAIEFMMWGGVCILLAQVLMELGKFLVFAGIGLIGALVEDAVDKQLVKDKLDFATATMDETGLSKKGEWQQNFRAQAEYDQKKNKVRYIPHD